MSRHEFTPGSPRPEGAGRKPGTPNRATSEAKRLAEEMGVDPFQVLLLFVKGDAEALDLPVHQLADGTEARRAVPLDMRLDAAKAAVQYLLPKRKALEVEATVNGPEQFLSLPEAVRHRMLQEMAARVLGTSDEG
jgi:antitoxin component of RelBE/YafQ-DinJ toxin-antitoxin module